MLPPALRQGVPAPVVIVARLTSNPSFLRALAATASTRSLPLANSQHPRGCCGWHRRLNNGDYRYLRSTRGSHRIIKQRFLQLNRGGPATEHLSAWSWRQCSSGRPTEKGNNEQAPSNEPQDERYELSRRERMWRKRMDEIRKWIDEDPYEALFGTSNRMLRGKLGEHGWLLASPLPRWFERKMRELREDRHRVEDISILEANQAKDENSQSATSQLKPKKVLIETETVPDEPIQPRMGRSSAPPSSTAPMPDGSLEYDPISNRMIRKSDKAFSHYGQELDLGNTTSSTPVTSDSVKEEWIDHTTNKNSELLGTPRHAVPANEKTAESSSDVREEYNKYKSKRFQNVELDDSWLDREGFRDVSASSPSIQEYVNSNEEQKQAAQQAKLERDLQTKEPSGFKVVDLKPWKGQRSHGTTLLSSGKYPETSSPRHNSKPEASHSLQTALERHNKDHTRKGISEGAIGADHQDQVPEPRRDHDPYGYDHSRESDRVPLVVDSSYGAMSDKIKVNPTAEQNAVAPPDPALNWSPEAKKEYLESLEKELEDLNELKDPQNWMRAQKETVEGKINLLKNQDILRKAADTATPADLQAKLETGRSRLRGLLAGPLAWLGPKRDPQIYRSEQDAMQKSAEGRMLAAEVEKQKAAMTKLSETARNFKIPDPPQAKSIFPDPEQLQKRAAEETAKREQRAKDADLVREITNIYENKYGPITTSHRQANADPDPPAVQSVEGLPSTPADQEVLKTAQSSSMSPLKPEPLMEATLPSIADSERPSSRVESVRPETSEADSAVSSPRDIEVNAVYTILAYDPSSCQVTSATVCSPPLSDEATIPLTVALRELSEPAKFLPHLQGLRDTGFVPVSGSNNLLILRKTWKDGAVTASEDKSPTSPAASKPEVSQDTGEKTLINPIDKTGFHVPTGDFASPTGFVNYNRYEPSLEGEGAPSCMTYGHTAKGDRESTARTFTAAGSKPHHRHNHYRTPKRIEPVFSGGARPRFDNRRRHRRGWRRIRRGWRVIKELASILGITVAAFYLAGLLKQLNIEINSGRTVMRREEREALKKPDE